MKVCAKSETHEKMNFLFYIFSSVFKCRIVFIVKNGTLRGLIFTRIKFRGFREIKSTRNISKCAIREIKSSRKITNLVIRENKSSRKFHKKIF